MEYKRCRNDFRPGQMVRIGLSGFSTGCVIRRLQHGELTRHLISHQHDSAELRPVTNLERDPGYNVWYVLTPQMGPITFSDHWLQAVEEAEL